MNERPVAYETNFDRLAYQNKKDKEKLDAYTRKQLETHLGERFNVLLSETRYGIKDGQIYGGNTNEPFMDVLIRGANYRRLHGNPVDYKREEAEVLGFGKIEEKLADENSRVGTMMLSISPKGGKDSIYQHNFYDIFTLKEDERGKYIEARRYSSGLSTQETVQKLKEGYLLRAESTPTAEQFLGNPIEIERNNTLFKDADDIHNFLHKEHEYTTREEMDEGLRAVGFLITSYVNSLSENLSEAEIKMHLSALVNGLDIAMGKTITPFAANEDIKKILNSRDYIFVLGRQPVRPVMTGCGFSGDLPALSKTFIPGQEESPFSVSEFGKLTDKYGERTFNCPECGRQNLRPKDTLISKCQHCNSTTVAC